MENASKALTIAAGMLISLMIIGIVAFTYNNIKELQGEKDTSEERAQALEFNKKYDGFLRDNLYGSEVISAANQIADYNKREGQEKGYEKIKMEVTLIPEKEIVDAKYFKVGSYDQTQIISAYNGLEGEINDYTSKTYAMGKTIDYYITLRTKELQQLIRQYGEGTGRNNIPNESLRTAYQAVKDEMTYFKRKIFVCNAEYSGTTGRINKMIFTEKN